MTERAFPPIEQRMHAAVPFLPKTCASAMHGALNMRIAMEVFAAGELASLYKAAGTPGQQFRITFDDLR